MKSRVLLLCAFAAVAGLAQDRGTINGVVTDGTGAAVPDAAVSVRNPTTKFQQSTRTGPDGTYTIPYLTVGRYTVNIQKPGFRSAQTAEIQVSVNTVARVDVQLQVGEVQQTIEVAGAAPLLQTDRTDLGKVFGSKTILDLPLTLAGGLRNNLSFVLLTPGVTVTPGGDINSDLTLRIGGGLASGHSMLLDGAEANSERRFDPSFQSVSTDAIAEFKVQTGSYSAEYGRTSNGIINFTTKSGTNELHGSAFEFFRDEKLNARGYYPARRQIARQNTWGGTVGGPVYVPKLFDGRNKTFFFFSYERSRFRSGAPSNLISVPIAPLRQGDFRDWKDARGAVIPIFDPQTTTTAGGTVVRTQFPANVIPVSRIHPVAVKLNSLMPLPEIPGQLLNNILAAGNAGADQNVGSIKGDYNFSSKNRISGLFSRQFSGQPEQIGPLPGALGENWNSGGVNRFYRVNHDYVFSPSLLNHFTFGRNRREGFEFFPVRISEADRQLIQLKGATGSKTVPSVYTIGDGYARLNRSIDTFSPGTTTNINEQVAWIRGRHSLKFGFNYIRQDFRRRNCNNCSGEAVFDAAVTRLPGAAGQTGSAYAGFLLGLPFTGSRYDFGGDFQFGAPYYAWYAQDDFKVSSRLTLNLGLRYEIPIPKAERNGNNSNLCLNCPNPGANGFLGALQFAGVGTGRTGKPRFTEPRLNAWGPRLGLAYQLRSNTVVRAGGGVYYASMREGANSDRGITGFGGEFNPPSPDGVSPAFTLDSGFPAARRPPIIDPTVGLHLTVPYVPSYAGRAPYFYDWNFTLERSLNQSTVVRASYQATLGQKLLSTQENINQVDPKYLSLGTLLNVAVTSPAAVAAGIRLPYANFPTNFSVAQALRPLPQYTNIDRAVDSDTTGHSTYHALLLSAEHRYSRGLWFQASYTFSKLISNVQSEVPTRGNVAPQNGYDRRAEKTVSNQDVPHHVVAAYSYELPVGKGKRLLSGANAVANGVLGGWKLSGIHNLQSGYPLRVTSTQPAVLFGGGIRANLNPGVPVKNPAYDGDPNVAPYINPAAFSRPANFTFGNTGPNLPYLRAPAILSTDLAVAKDFLLGSEQRRLEFRASLFNAFNRTQFGSPILGVESPAFGRISSQANRPREIQFSLRLSF